MAYHTFSQQLPRKLAGLPHVARKSLVTGKLHKPGAFSRPTQLREKTNYLLQRSMRGDFWLAGATAKTKVV
ncbi:hypothetical protein [Luteolibacter soli]|uniref:Uncharacterized protein n=1 Tax=Luteolibacter soli TaxID=3135280 RepID=A0ABU9APR5_9BACT